MKKYKHIKTGETVSAEYRDCQTLAIDTSKDCNHDRGYGVLVNGNSNLYKKMYGEFEPDILNVMLFVPVDLFEKEFVKI